MFVRICLLFSALFILNSCAKKAEEQQPLPAADGTYFSITQFIKDQWDTHHGQPFSLKKVAYMNGTRDSAIISAYDMDWAAIFKVFIAADISAPKYVGKYDFTMFEDDMTVTRNFYYEAKTPELFTRKFHITADQFNNKIKSVFIETEKKTRWNTVSQRLFYLPLEHISIQEFEWPATGDKKEMRIEYRFM